MSTIQHITKPQTQAAWYALRTKSRCEKVVLQQLQKKGITAYLPLLSQTKRYVRKIRHSEQPMIPGYVFTHICPNQSVPALETVHAVNFIRFNNQLATIQDADIEVLRRIAGEAMILSTEPLSFEPGMQVEIIGGALTGLQGKIVSRKGKQVLLVDFDYLGASLVIDVDQNQLSVRRK